MESFNQLLQANLRLTEQVVDLARAVIASREPSVPVYDHTVPSLPGFDEFAAIDEMTPAEKLFYSEHEEDQLYADPTTRNVEDDRRTAQLLAEAARLEAPISAL